MTWRLGGIVAALACAWACSGPPPSTPASPPPSVAATPSAQSAAAPTRVNTSPTSEPKPWPLRPFPDSVAGFPFGATRERFAQICAEAGNEPVVLEGGIGAACSGVVVPMPFDVTVVIAFFCEGVACEYALKARPGAASAENLLARLADRYGAPFNPSNFHPRCDAEPPSKRLFWGWRRQAAREYAMLRLIFDCDPGEGPESRAAMLYYDDEAGAAWRNQQGKDQETNY